MARTGGNIMTGAALVFMLLAVSPALAVAAGGHGGEDGRQERAAAPAAATEHAVSPERKLMPKLPPDIREDYQKYCYNIADAARDARYARQKQQIREMEKDLEKLLRKLEKKRAEYETWVMRRKEITDRMTRAMLDVYAKMEPEAAAAQIAQMEYAVAVAILTGLKPQKASAILTEMDPKKAGRLVNAIVGVVAEATPQMAGETN